MKSVVGVGFLPLLVATCFFGLVQSNSVEFKENGLQSILPEWERPSETYVVQDKSGPVTFMPWKCMNISERCAIRPRCHSIDASGTMRKCRQYCTACKFCYQPKFYMLNKKMVYREYIRTKTCESCVKYYICKEKVCETPAPCKLS